MRGEPNTFHPGCILRRSGLVLEPSAGGERFQAARQIGERRNSLNRAIIAACKVRRRPATQAKLANVSTHILAVEGR